MTESEYLEYHKERLYKLLVHCKQSVGYWKQNNNYALPLPDEFTYDFFGTRFRSWKESANI